MTKYKTKVDIVYESLMKDITKGTYRPGDRLVMSQISKQYNVSDIPVREAIRNLESEGYVTIIANQGAVVNSFDIENLTSIIQIKAVLEGYATLQSIDYITPKLLGKLAQMNDQMRAAFADENHKKYSLLNMQFHMEIYSCIPNRELYSMIDGLWKKWSITKTVFGVAPDSAVQSITEHETIIAMLEGKNYGEIELFVRNHKLRAGNSLLERLPE